MAPIIQIISAETPLRPELPTSRFDVTTAAEPGVKRQVIVWTDGNIYQILPSDINMIITCAETNQFPVEVREFCVTNSESNVVVSLDRSDLTLQASVDGILLPHDLIDGLRFIKAIVEHPPHKESPKRTEALYAGVFMAFISLGRNFEQLFKKNVPHTWAPVEACFAYYGINEEASSCTPSQLVNLGLMGILAIGKNVNSLNSMEFQRNRFDACVASAGKTLVESNFLPTDTMIELNRGWIYFEKFVQQFVSQFLIGSVPADSTPYESAVIGQARLVLANSLMRTFMLSLSYLEDWGTAHFLTIKEINDDMIGGYKEAVQFYFSVPEAQRPYIRLLKLPQHTKLEYKNYPYIYYAAGCLAKFEGGESSIRNLIVENIALNESSARKIRIAAATYKPRSGSSTDITAANSTRSEWQSILTTAHRTFHPLGDVFNEEVTMTAPQLTFVATGMINNDTTVAQRRRR